MVRRKADSPALAECSAAPSQDAAAETKRQESCKAVKTVFETFQASAKQLADQIK